MGATCSLCCRRGLAVWWVQGVRVFLDNATLTLLAEASTEASLVSRRKAVRKQSNRGLAGVSDARDIAGTARACCASMLVLYMWLTS